MNHFDSGVLLWLNQFALRSPGFDSAVAFANNSDMLKGQAFMLALVWFWFSPEERRARNREIILTTLVAAFAAILLGRILAAFLPFRLRPAFNPELVLNLPPGTNMKLRTWSSFPSDHAMLFSALSTGLFIISPAFGAAAYVYALVIIDLPRVYLGLHNPTDIMGGAALGTAVAWTICSERLRRPIAAPLLEALRRRERLFCMALFFVSVEIMTMFAEPRAVAAAACQFLKGIR